MQSGWSLAVGTEYVGVTSEIELAAPFPYGSAPFAKIDTACSREPNTIQNKIRQAC